MVSQQLLPDVSGGMIPACEILQVNNAVRSMIRDNKNHQIGNAIAKLYKEGRVSQEVALLYADKPEQLKRQL